MKWSDVGKSLAKSAPLIGGALGGPGGAALGTVIANVLGVEAEPGRVAALVQSDPSAALKLAQWEMVNADKIRNHSRMVLEAELKDSQHARDTHKLSIVPNIMVFVLTGMVGAIYASLMLFPIPEGNRDTILTLLGNIVPVWMAASGYWVGTSRSSGIKDLQMLKK